MHNMFKSIQFRFKAVHSEEQGVILQVLAIVDMTVAEVLVGDELLSPYSNCSLSLCDTSTGPFRNIIIKRPNFSGEVPPILQLVEQAHFDGAFEGPLQIVIIVSSHQIGVHRHECLSLHRLH